MAVTYEQVRDWVLALPGGVAAQGNPEPHSFKFNTGQGLTPIFEQLADAFVTTTRWSVS